MKPVDFGKYDCKIINQRNNGTSEFAGTFDIIDEICNKHYGYQGYTKRFIREAAHFQTLFHTKIRNLSDYDLLDINKLYGYSMTKCYIPAGKPIIIPSTFKPSEDQTFVVEVEIVSIDEKRWSKDFVKGSIHKLDNIMYYNLIRYQNATFKIIRGIYWPNPDKDYHIRKVATNILNKIAVEDDEKKKKTLKNTLNQVWGMLLSKNDFKIHTFTDLDKMRKYAKKWIMFVCGSSKKKNGDYILRSKRYLDVNYVNNLLGVHILSASKSIMFNIFDFCDKNNIHICYCNTDSLLIEKKYLDLLSDYIGPNPGQLKIEAEYDSIEIASQGKYCFKKDGVIIKSQGDFV